MNVVFDGLSIKYFDPVKTLIEQKMLISSCINVIVNFRRLQFYTMRCAVFLRLVEFQAEFFFTWFLILCFLRVFYCFFAHFLIAFLRVFGQFEVQYSNKIVFVKKPVATAVSLSFH